MLTSLVTLALALAPSYLENADFGAGTRGWEVPPGATVVASGDPRVGNALRVVADPKPGQPQWELQLRQPVGAPLKAGKALRVRFWGRSAEGVPISVRVQDAGPPYETSIEQTVNLAPEWREFVLNGAAVRDYAAAGAHLSLHLNLRKGTIELGGFRLDEPAGSGATYERPTDLFPGLDLRSVMPPAWRLVGMGPEAVKPATGPDGAPAVALTTPGGQNPWSVSFGRPLGSVLGAGEVAELRVWLRSPGRTRTTLILERASEPHPKFLTQTVRPTPEWKEYRFAAPSPARFEPGEAQFVMFLGQEAGTVEVAGLSLKNYGRTELSRFPQSIDYFGGVPNPDTWRKAAEARIERIRKGDVVVSVVGATGRPVRNAQVRIEQKRHGFRFGTAVPASRINGTDPDSVRYREYLKKHFNTIVFENDLKWPVESPEAHAAVKQALDWLEKNGFESRGHNMVWGSWSNLPAGFETLSNDELKRRIRERIDRVGRMYAGRLYCWDVVNEAVTERALWDRLGWDFFAETYKLARQADPKAQLVYNDFNITEENAAGPAHGRRAVELIQMLIDKGAPLDVIGIQCHVGPPLTSITRVLEILDELAKFKRPIEVTEWDLGGVPDPQLHARYSADYLTAMFSHPSVQSFLAWGFWEGAHWRAREGAAVVRRDWTETPSAVAYRELVLNRWWTRARGRTNAQGAFRTRAFYGTHEVTVTVGGRTAKATVTTKPGAPARVTVRL